MNRKICRKKGIADHGAASGKSKTLNEQVHCRHQIRLQRYQ